MYRSMLREAEDIRALAKEALAMPVLAVGGLTGGFTATTMRQVATGVRATPDRLAEVLLGCYHDIDPEA